MDAPLLVYSLSQIFLRALLSAEAHRLPALWRQAHLAGLYKGLGLRLSNVGAASGSVRVMLYRRGGT